MLECPHAGEASAPTARAGRRCSAEAGPPVGVEMLDIWKWPDPPFPRGCRKSFPTDLLEMEEVQDSRHFQISKAISTDIKAGPVGWTSWMPPWGWGRTSNEAPAVVFHPTEPNQPHNPGDDREREGDDHEVVVRRQVARSLLTHVLICLWLDDVKFAVYPVMRVLCLSRTRFFGHASPQRRPPFRIGAVCGVAAPKGTGNSLITDPECRARCEAGRL
jgi:hypothetical protein